MNFSSPKSSRVRHSLSVLASTTTAVALLLGSSITAMPAVADGTSAPAIGKEAALGTETPTVDTDRIIVKFSGSAKDNAQERGNAYGKLAKQYGISVKEVKETADGAQIIKADRKLSSSEAKSLAGAFQAQSNVEYAEPDILMQVTGTPNDTHYPKQWGVFEETGGIRLPNVWDKTTGAGQVVAVIDSGITSHSDLNSQYLPGYDMMSESSMSRDGGGRDSNPQDEGDWRNAGDCGISSSAKSSWHGTHVAGTVAAVANNATGFAGVAYGAKILPVRAIGFCGGYMSDIADGVVWASGAPVAGAPLNANPARAINLSLGGPSSCTYTLQKAIDTATSRGSSVFVASGNSNVDASTFAPANCQHVIAVGATNREGAKSSFSNYGSTVDVSAPGGDSTGGIGSTVNLGETTPGAEGYNYMQGTSMATPHVSAVAALMMAADPSLTPAAVEAKLKETARPLPVPCSAGCGAGIIDASAAVVFPEPAAEPTPEPSQEPAPAPSPSPSQEPAPITVTISPVSSSVPTISGKTEVGQTLTANPGEWGPEGVTLSYQWNVDGTAVSGATNSTYELAAADLGKTVNVTVTGSKTGYTSKSETSANTSPIAKGWLTTTAASITGLAKVNYRLTVNHETWGPEPVAMSYQWYRSGTAISGATGSSYVLTGSDWNKTITVRVIGRKEGYVAVYRQSAATDTVAPGDLKGEFPKISGTTKVGYKLTANPGLWTAGTTAYYQWYRDGVAISGATSRYFTLTEADRGSKIRVKVLGKKYGYTSRAYYSYSTAVIS